MRRALLAIAGGALILILPRLLGVHPSTQNSEPYSGVTPAAMCKPGSVEIKQFSPSISDPCATVSCPQLRLVGELMHSCPMPVGVKLRIVARDAKGQVIATQDGWPASTNNIQPQTPYAFDLSGLIDYSKEMRTFAVNVEEVRHWNSR